MRLWAALVLSLSSCAAPDRPPPALPGPAAVYFMPLSAIPGACAPASRWVEACTRMDAKPRMIVLPLPQDYPGDEYAGVVQLELAHVQRDWPDPPEIRARRIHDAIAR